MVNMLKSKKGVEMSLNLIILLIIGLTILGLVISFVTGFLGQASNTFSGKISDDDQVKLNQVKNEPGNFAIIPTTLNVKKGSTSASKLFIKVRNPTNELFDYTPTGENSQLTSDDALSVTISAGKGAGDIYPKIYGPPISLEGGEEGAYPLEVYAESDVLVGTYYAKFILRFDDGTETQKLVTLNVE